MRDHLDKIYTAKARRADWVNRLRKDKNHTARARAGTVMLRGAKEAGGLGDV